MTEMIFRLSSVDDFGEVTRWGYVKDVLEYSKQTITRPDRVAYVNSANFKGKTLEEGNKMLVAVLAAQWDMDPEKVEHLLYDG